MKTTEDLFQKRLHTYTLTHAIEDGNVLRFHVDYFKPQGKTLPKPGEPLHGVKDTEFEIYQPHHQELLLTCDRRRRNQQCPSPDRRHPCPA